jgi:hypothetical protein
MLGTLVQSYLFCMWEAEKSDHEETQCPGRKLQPSSNTQYDNSPETPGSERAHALSVVKLLDVLDGTAKSALAFQLA